MFSATLITLSTKAGALFVDCIMAFSNFPSHMRYGDTNVRVVERSPFEQSRQSFWENDNSFDRPVPEPMRTTVTSGKHTITAEIDSAGNASVTHHKKSSGCCCVM
jgi:hypothetical protein